MPYIGPVSKLDLKFVMLYHSHLTLHLAPVALRRKELPNAQDQMQLDIMYSIIIYTVTRRMSGGEVLEDIMTYAAT